MHHSFHCGDGQIHCTVAGADGGTRCGLVFGALLVAAGTLFLLEALGVLAIPWGLIWPSGLILLGLWTGVALIRRRRASIRRSRGEQSNGSGRMAGKE